MNMDKPNTKTLPHNNSEWNGYTIDELRYMRAYTAARMEISRERLVAKVSSVKKDGIMGAGKGSVVGRLLGAVGYVDMAILGWKISRRVFKTMKILRRK